MAEGAVQGKIQEIDFKSQDVSLREQRALNKAIELINQGKIVAIKGLGGYHLAVDARNEEAVSRLRKRKHRYGKPLAVMMPNIDDVKKYCILSDAEREILQSNRAPIVLLKKRQDSFSLAYSVTMNLNTIGVMLPYTSIHKLIMENAPFPLVMTSGNISDEPICTNEEEAYTRLKDVADGFLYHDRRIQNRIDDSVCFYGADGTRLVRRGRGFATEPFLLKNNSKQILACGGFYKNTFCLLKNEQVFVSQHIGDLDNTLTYRYYIEEIQKYKIRFSVNPSFIVRDLHPLYPSSIYADKFGLPSLSVQHHHAHIASVIAEYGLSEKVLGIAYDGTGLGSDGNIWGAEFLITDLKNYHRVGHLKYVPLPGGDMAIKHPFRSALGFIYPNMDQFSVYLARLDGNQVKIILKQIEKNVNSPLASSMGRLFDAVASIINIRDSVNYEGQAAMELESVIIPTDEFYTYDIEVEGNTFCINVDKTLEEIYRDFIKGVSQGIISAKFHNTVIKFSVDMAKRIREIHLINKIVLSGGCFQNRYLLEGLNINLQEQGFQTYIPSKIPINDGGISLGQAAIASAYFS